MVISFFKTISKSTLSYKYYQIYSNYSNLSNLSEYLCIDNGLNIYCQEEDEGCPAPVRRENLIVLRIIKREKRYGKCTE